MKLAGGGNVFSGADKKTDHPVVFLFFSTRLLSGLNISILLFSGGGFKKRAAIRIRCFAL
ncbi:MAG TPA: hypothetical protein DEB43_06380 [Desulfovibrio sp.]|nr:hypothetical protein [Desulfovibrio sp.]